MAELSVRWRRAAALAVLLLHAAAVALFARGFLLTKVSLDDTAYAAPQPPAHDRLVMIVVDALRYDMALSPHLSSLETALARWPSHTVLSRFRADAPTTTLQRLKALTTGTLPTFVEAGTNFASGEVTEDSLPRQWRRAGRRVHFVGDDTWLACFPDTFTEAHGFPSFDVWDLDTVDDGVEAHIFPALDRPDDWDVLVAHMLGVDHAGHRYGRAHPAMAAKLAQTDALLARVIAALPPRTLLAVLGDHGMTESGDHGGDSLLETDAALFLYSTSDAPLQRSQCAGGLCGGIARVGHTVDQVDLVPTLAALTGVAIPFSSVGVVMPTLFQSDGALVEALAANAEQVSAYLARYREAAGAAGGLAAAELDRLDGLLAAARADGLPRDSAAASLHAYLREAAAVCRAAWTRFEVPWMAAGAAVAAYSALPGSAPVTDAAVLLAALVGYLVGSAALVVVAAAAAGALALWRLRAPRKWPSLPTIVAVAALGASAAVFASNSFVVWEDAVGHYLLQTLLAVLGAGAVVRGDAPTAVLFAHAMALARYAATLSVCREEQQPHCVVTAFPERFEAAAALAALVHGALLLAVHGHRRAALLFAVFMAALALHWHVDATQPVDGALRLALPRGIAVAIAAVLLAGGRFAGDASIARYAAVLCAVQLLSGPFAVRACAAHLASTLVAHRAKAPPLVHEVLHMLAAQQFFFRAGHQATLSSIQWWPALIGLANVHMAVSGVLVTLSFFGGAVLAAPAAATVPSAGIGARRAVYGVLLAACMALTAHLRRHLMVWKIFAPRFVTLALATLISDLFRVMWVARD